MSVDTVTRKGLGTQTIKLKRREIFFHLGCVDPVTGVHPVTYSTDNGGYFRSGKAAGT